MRTKDDRDVAKLFLEHLPKLDVDIVVNAANRLRFEYSLLSAAGLNHESEVELVRAVVGEEFNQAQSRAKAGGGE
jgi:hypothetical protein